MPDTNCKVVIDLTGDDYEDEGVAPATSELLNNVVLHEHDNNTLEQPQQLALPDSGERLVDRTAPPESAIVEQQQVQAVAQFGTEENPLEILDGPEIEAPNSRNRAPPSKLQDGLVLFSDGSRTTEGWGGAGVAFEKDGHWQGRALALGHITSSSEAEIRAIHEAVRMARDHLLPTHRQLVIYTDSSDAISRITRDCAVNRAQSGFLGPIAKEMRDLRERCEVKLLWVKGHHVSTGNAIADQLAGTASTHSRLGNPIGPVHIGPQDMLRVSKKAKLNTLIKRRRIHQAKPKVLVAPTAPKAMGRESRRGRKREGKQEGKRERLFSRAARILASAY